MVIRNDKPILALVGPTGSGKSSIASSLASDLGGEIISCDSVQVYRGFDIGSAKPTSSEQKAVPHHGVDICDWWDAFDANQFRSMALKAIADCRSRGKVPILCGGTGLYYRILRWGLVDSPGTNEKLRSEFEQLEREHPGALVKRLLEVDPASAGLIDLQNPRRVLRALEIFELSGKTPTQLRRQHGFKTEEVPMLVASIQWEPKILRKRIQTRLNDMLAKGWVGEVQDLLANGVSADSVPMKSVGYREIASWLDFPTTDEELRSQIEKSTWTYARRQRTWFKKEKAVWPIIRTQNQNTTSVLTQIKEKFGW